MRRLLYKYFSGDYLHAVHLFDCHYRAKIAFVPRPDCPARFRGAPGEPPLDSALSPVIFPCGAGRGCGGPGCRWSRQADHPLPLPPRRAA